MCDQAGSVRSVRVRGQPNDHHQHFQDYTPDGTPAGRLNDGETLLAGQKTDADGRPKALLTPYGFGGYRYDEVTGLYHAPGRTYDPASARFLTQDPVAPNAIDQWNLYRYAGNDPVNLVYPTGYGAFEAAVGSGRRSPPGCP